MSTEKERLNMWAYIDFFVGQQMGGGGQTTILDTPLDILNSDGGAVNVDSGNFLKAAVHEIARDIGWALIKFGCHSFDLGGIRTLPGEGGKDPGLPPSPHHHH